MVGWLAENSKTTSAVFGPTPGNCIKVFLASSSGNDNMGLSVPWYFSRMVVAACFIVLALLLYKPEMRIASSIWLASDFARTSGVISNRFDRASKALAVFMSAVFCETIVVTNVSHGSLRCLTHLGNVSVCCSFCRMIAAL